MPKGVFLADLTWGPWKRDDTGVEAWRDTKTHGLIITEWGPYYSYLHPIPAYTID
jgi:hypothetical protein